MKIVKEFSRFAHEYNQYNVIQEEVAKKLTSMIVKKSYNKVLDLGAGSGAIYQNFLDSDISFTHFTALDFSKEMLEIHPKSINLSTYCMDFNSPLLASYFSKNEFDLIISSSALQWSQDLNKLTQLISKFSREQYFSFFTSNTFFTLHKTAGIKSPIYEKQIIINILNRYYQCEFETVEYRLDFDTVQEMFRYIKHSGVSGGTGQLSFLEMKRLMRNYPLKYLEFEVLFVKAKSLIFGRTLPKINID